LHSKVFTPGACACANAHLFAFFIHRSRSGIQALNFNGVPPLRLRGLVFATFFLSVFTNLLMLTGSLFMLQVYDRVLASRSEETLVVLFGLVVLLYVFYWLIDYARGRVMSRVGARVQDTLNRPVFEREVDQAVGRVRQANMLGVSAGS